MSGSLTSTSPRPQKNDMQVNIKKKSRGDLGKLLFFVLQRVSCSCLSLSPKNRSHICLSNIEYFVYLFYQINKLFSYCFPALALCPSFLSPSPTSSLSKGLIRSEEIAPSSKVKIVYSQDTPLLTQVVSMTPSGRKIRKY